MKKLAGLLTLLFILPGFSLLAADGPSEATAGQATADAAYQFAIARLAAAEGSYTEALEAFDTAIELAPDDPYIRVELANLLARLGRFTVSPDQRDRRFQRAAEQAAKAAELAPADFDVLFEVGHVFLNFADQDEAWAAQAVKALEGAMAQRPDDPRVLLPLGQLYLDADRFEDAVDVLRVVWRSVPGNDMAESLYGEALSLLVTRRIREGHSAEAEELLAEVLQLEPASAQARVSLADLQAQRGDHAAAAETLRAGLELGNAELRQRLVYELYQSGSLDEASKEIVELLDSDSAAAGALEILLLAARGRLDAALDALDARPGEPEDRLALAVTVARLMDRDGFHDDAVRMLRAYIDRREAAGEAQGARSLRLELAQLFAGNERWQELIELIDPILKGADAEVDAPLRLLYAEALTQLGRTDEALAYLPEEKTGPFLAKRAETLLRLGREQEGQRLLDRLEESGSAEGTLQAALVFQRLERYAEAIPLLEAIVAGDAESVEGRYYLGAAYERAGRVEDAERSFRALLDDSPDFAPALNYLGYMWAERGEKLEEALRMINKAVALDPDNGSYVDSLGWVHYQLKDFERAREYLERAAKLVPDDPTIYEHLGDVLSALGETVLARDYYRRALALEGALDEASSESLRRKLSELGVDPPAGR